MTRDDGHDGDFPTAPSATRSSDAVAIALAASTTNQDGRSASLTAPNGASQQALVRDAIRALANDRGGDRVDPLDAFVSVAAHGTPDAARRSHRGGGVGRGVRVRPLRLAAPKSASGHAEGAAGTHSLLVAARDRAGHLPAHRSPATYQRARGRRVRGRRRPRRAEATATGDDARDSLGRRVRGVQRVRHERRQRARRRGTGAFTRSRRKRENRGGATPRRDRSRVVAKHARFIPAIRATAARITPRLDAILGYPRRSSSVSFVFSATDSPCASVFKDHRVRGRALFPGAAGLCAFVAAARASLGTRTDVADVAVVDVIFARPVDADADVACEIFARRRRLRRRRRDARENQPRRARTRRAFFESRRFPRANRDESRAVWNRDSGTTRESLAGWT